MTCPPRQRAASTLPPRPRRPIKDISVHYVGGAPCRLEIDLDDPELSPSERLMLEGIAARLHRQFKRDPLSGGSRRLDWPAPDYPPYA